MIREFSAGGIVYKIKDQSASWRTKIKKNDLLWLIAQHSQHKGWVFPKGLIGDQKKGESSVDTAVREVKEETGVDAEIIAKLKKPVAYFYTWQGEKRFKTVAYFLMKYVSGDIANHDFEMSAVEWVSEEETKERLSYKSDKEAFEQALELMKTLPS